MQPANILINIFFVAAGNFVNSKVITKTKTNCQPPQKKSSSSVDRLHLQTHLFVNLNGWFWNKNCKPPQKKCPSKCWQAAFAKALFNLYILMAVFGIKICISIKILAGCICKNAFQFVNLNADF